MSYQLTKKEITKELLKCGKDPTYFINSYCKISHPMQGLIPFKLYDYQEDLIEDFNDYRFNIILKARQLGISTITAAYVVWLMMFHRNKNVLVVATKYHTAANLVKKVKAIIKHLPLWIQMAKVIVDNRASFELSNGSQIKASSTSVDAGRSEALSLLVVDEAAHVEGLDELWTGLYPTISTGGRCIALSTPNGVGGWFFKTYVDAQARRNDFHSTELMWDIHPDRDQNWFEKETRNMSVRQISQELECNFNTSGETVIHTEDLVFIEKNIKEPKYRTAFDRNFWIWEEHRPENSYMITADVARGDGQDYSVFHVFKLETSEIVAEYQGKVAPDVFSNIVSDAGKEYGNCLLVVENNSVGFAVLEKLKDIGYPNIYYSIKSTHEYIDQLTAEHKSNSVAGFTTSLKTRPIIVSKMEEFIRNKLITTYSSRLYNEFKTFIWNNGKAQAMRSENDDLVMSFAIGCWVKDTVFVENRRKVEYQKACLNSMFKSDNIINTSIPGMKQYKPIKKSNEMKKSIDDQKNFIWLLKG
tara:strand:- start:28968 stop:30554 length:1587 start_codon:yes stop_codon:yes gene_type:complete